MEIKKDNAIYHYIDELKAKTELGINIAESFNNLFKNDTEYFYLDFENGNIVKKSLSAEETSKAINQTENENQDSKKKNKKKKNKKNKKKKNNRKIK